MARRQASLLSLVKVLIRDKGSLRRRLMVITTKNQMTLLTKLYRWKIAHESEHSCHGPSHMTSTLSPQFFGDLSAPEVACH